jgi:hypothetical protein
VSEQLGTSVPSIIPQDRVRSSSSGESGRLIRDSGAKEGRTTMSSVSSD